LPYVYLNVISGISKWRLPERDAELGGALAACQLGNGL